MAEYNPPPTPPRDHAPERGARNETHIHSTSTAPHEKRSGTAIAFIVGGVAVGLLVLYFLFAGFGTTTAPTTGAPATDTTADPGTGTGTTDTAPAAEPAAPAADPEPAPQPPAATDGAGETAPAPEPVPAD